MLYGTIMEVVFLAVSLVVALYSSRIYKICKMDEARKVSYAFWFFAAAYFWEVMLNLFSFSNIEMFFGLEILSIPYFLFYLLGLIQLSFVVLGGKNKSIFYLLGTISFISIIGSANLIKFFHLLSLVILVFLGYFVGSKYMIKGKNKSLIFLAFIILLLFGHLPYLILGNEGVCNIIEHIVFFVAHLILLFVLLLVIFYGFKKRKARSH